MTIKDAKMCNFVCKEML